MATTANGSHSAGAELGEWMDYAVLLAVGLSLTFWFASEPRPTDDLTYFDVARQTFLRLDPRDYEIANAYRGGLTLPSALAQSMLGSGVRAYYASAVWYSIFALLALRFFARFFLSRHLATLAALATATSPFFLATSSLLLPDWGALAWALTGAGIFLRRLEDPKGSTRYAIACGVLFFLSIYTKESMAPFVVLLVGLALLIYPPERWWKPAAIATATTLALALCELALNATLYGDPLARPHALLGGHIAGAQTWAEASIVRADLTWPDLALSYPRLLWKTKYGAMMVGLLGIALVATTFSADLRSRYLAWLVFGTLAFLSLAVVSLEPLIPLQRPNDRYFSIVFAPGAVLVIAAARHAFARLEGWRGARGATLAGVAVLLLLPVRGVYEYATDGYYRRSGSDISSSIARVIDSIPTPPRIQMDRRGFRAVRVWLRKPIPNRALAIRGKLQIGLDDLESGDVVVLDEYLKSRLKEPAPAWFAEPPASWSKLGGDRRFTVWQVR